MGNGLLLKNKDEEAIKAYQTAISHDQTHTNAYNNLGLVYSDRKQYPQAIEILEKARKIHPDSPIILLNLGNAYLGKGDIYAAVSAYERCLELWDGDAQTAKSLQQTIEELKATMGP